MIVSIVVISKDEPALGHTLGRLTKLAATSAVSAGPVETSFEVVVVDASRGRLDYLRDDSAVRWIDYVPPAGVGISIPHQRNVGVRAALGDIIVFTDAGCDPVDSWLESLLAPILSGEEDVVTGLTLSTTHNELYDHHAEGDTSGYVDECATINLAFRRSVFEDVGGFDETFQYGSDVDFTWRVRDRGTAIRRVPEAVVRHDWGGRKRQLKRSYRYGAARVRLYNKHRERVPSILRRDPVVVIYPLFIVLLPLAIVFPAYLLLLLVPIIRNRNVGPVRTVVDHLAYGWGVLVELSRL